MRCLARRSNVNNVTAWLTAFSRSGGLIVIISSMFYIFKCHEVDWHFTLRMSVTQTCVCLFKANRPMVSISLLIVPLRCFMGLNAVQWQVLRIRSPTESSAFLHVHKITSPVERRRYLSAALFKTRRSNCSKSLYCYTFCVRNYLCQVCLSIGSIFMVCIWVPAFSHLLRFLEG